MMYTFIVKYTDTNNDIREFIYTAFIERCSVKSFLNLQIALLEHTSIIESYYRVASDDEIQCYIDKIKARNDRRADRYIARILRQIAK